MGTNLRIVYNHIGLTLTLTASSAATGYPASNLETGSRALFWRATSTAEQLLTYDAGVGNTKTCDTVVLPRADLLVAYGANVAIQHSPDMTNWTDAFSPEVPIQAGDLSGPRSLDYYMEFSSAAKRGWRIRLYGTPSQAASLAGGLFLGQRFEVASNPQWGRTLGPSRTYMGAGFEFSWPPMTPTNTLALLDVVSAVTPDAAEGFVTTVAGVGYGGLAHYLYDPTGVVFGRSTPVLYPVLCLADGISASMQALAPLLERGPTIRWQERR